MTAIVTTGASGTASTFTKVYDSNDGNDFNGSKTLAQIGITAADGTAILSGKLQMGPTAAGVVGYSHNRATFTPNMKYGRIIAEYAMPPTATDSGVFAGQEGGFDYFGYPSYSLLANLLGTTGTESNRNIVNKQGNPRPPAGNLCRYTLDLLPDIGGTRRVVFQVDDLTAGTTVSMSAYVDNTIPNLTGTFGVWNNSYVANTGAGFTRVAIYSLNGAADLPPVAGVKNIVAIGDSITQGARSGGTDDMSAADFSYPAQLSRLLDGTYSVTNRGHSGFTSANMSAYFPLDVSPLYSATYAKNVALIYAGTNDIGMTTDTASTIYANIAAFHNQARARGFLTVAVVPYRAVYPAGFTRSGASTDYNATVDALAALMVAGWRSFADGLVNPGADSRFSVPSTNPLLADQLHMNASGYTYLAGLVNTAVLALPPAPFLYASDSLALLAQPTHAVFVLEGPMTLTYRSTTYTVPTGVSVNVPMSIYDLLRLDGFIA